jgi:hypothetical protein
MINLTCWLQRDSAYCRLVMPRSSWRIMAEVVVGGSGGGDADGMRSVSDVTR